MVLLVTSRMRRQKDGVISVQGWMEGCRQGRGFLQHPGEGARMDLVAPGARVWTVLGEQSGK